jgi:RNA polymerase sigma factor (sigma-70 family)
MESQQFGKETGLPEERPDSLLDRIRGGDREAAAEFVRLNEALLRRRYRHKLGSALRRLVDSEDLVSTVSRRLDAYVLSGRVRAVTLQQLWALIQRIIENTLADKARLLARLRRAEAEDAQLAAAIAARVEPRADLHAGLEQLLELVDNPLDREVVHLWLSGLQLKLIAEQLGMTEENARKRWQRIKTRLRERLSAA